MVIDDKGGEEHGLNLRSLAKKRGTFGKKGRGEEELQFRVYLF